MIHSKKPASASTRSMIRLRNLAYSVFTVSLGRATDASKILSTSWAFMLQVVQLVSFLTIPHIYYMDLKSEELWPDAGVWDVVNYQTTISEFRCKVVIQQPLFPNKLWPFYSPTPNNYPNSAWDSVQITVWRKSVFMTRGILYSLQPSPLLLCRSSWKKMSEKRDCPCSTGCFILFRSLFIFFRWFFPSLFCKRLTFTPLLWLVVMTLIQSQVHGGNCDTHITRKIVITFPESPSVSHAVIGWILVYGDNRNVYWGLSYKPWYHTDSAFRFVFYCVDVVQRRLNCDDSGILLPVRIIMMQLNLSQYSDGFRSSISVNFDTPLEL